MPPSRILGIDPALAMIGYGAIKIIDTNPVAIDYGVISTPANTEIGTRLITIHDDLTELIEHIKPELVVVEKFFSRNLGVNAGKVAQARGVIMLVIARYNAPLLEFTASQVKLQLTGSGKAEKIEVQEAVMGELNLPSIPRPDDAADALALALTGYYRHGEVIS